MNVDALAGLLFPLVYVSRSTEMRRSAFWFVLFVGIALGCNGAHAGQGFDCAGFLKLTKKEQRNYLDGYLLGAAMELGYLRLNVVGSPARELVAGPDVNISIDELDLRRVVRKAVDYVEQKDSLISIGGKYRNEFHHAVIQQCKSPNLSDAGMFIVLPGTLKMMQETGKYPVPGMQRAH